jgi:hypothetical protein
MSNLHREVNFENEICEYLAVTDKIDVRSFTH